MSLLSLPTRPSLSASLTSQSLFKSPPAPYQYIEVDPYSKPASLLELNSKGLVPSLRLGQSSSEVKGLSESTVILEYLEDRYAFKNSNLSLFTTQDPFEKAKSRLASDQINRTIIPNFYRYLQSQESEIEKRKESLEDFSKGLEVFSKSMKGKNEEGSSKGYWNSRTLSLPDITLIPWIIRAELVLTHYRSFDFDKLLKDEDGKESRFGKWYQTVKNDPEVMKTTSLADLYLDSYKRYADNKGHVSQVQQAINSGSEYF